MSVPTIYRKIQQVIGEDYHKGRDRSKKHKKVNEKMFKINIEFLRKTGIRRIVIDGAGVVYNTSLDIELLKFVNKYGKMVCPVKDEDVARSLK